MPEDLPFDPAPRPGEAAAIVARARRRKALHAAVPMSALAAVAVLASLVVGPTARSDQQLRLADDPLTPATETARPGPSPDPDTTAAPASPAGSAAAAVSLPPAPGASASPTASPRPSRSARPGERRPYRGDLGPRVEEYGYPACRRSQLEPGSRTFVHAGFCVQPTFRAPARDGVTDLAPTLRLCWQAETVYNGFLEFPTQEEADITLRDGDGRVLVRFSDSVTYTSRPHVRRVLQGDCLVWSMPLPFDADRHDEGRYVLRLETTTTTFAARSRAVELPFDV